MAVLVSQIDKRIHWLEAAARWLSLGREQGVLLPRRKPTGTRRAVTASLTQPNPRWWSAVALQNPDPWPGLLNAGCLISVG